MAGLSYEMSVNFSEKYPFDAPTVKFITPCFHPNVDTAGTHYCTSLYCTFLDLSAHRTGNICLDILKDKWSAAYSVRTVLVSIQSLLVRLSPPRNLRRCNPLSAAF